MSGHPHIKIILRISGRFAIKISIVSVPISTSGQVMNPGENERNIAQNGWPNVPVAFSISNAMKLAGDLAWKMMCSGEIGRASCRERVFVGV